jgi:hypothetical protein
MFQIKSKPDRAGLSSGAIRSGAAKTRRAPIASGFDRHTQKPSGMISLRQMCQQPPWNDILTKKHRGWGYVPSSYLHRSERLGRASKLECHAREEVLERFLLGWSAAIPRVDPGYKVTSKDPAFNMRYFASDNRKHTANRGYSSGIRCENATFAGNRGLLQCRGFWELHRGRAAFSYTFARRASRREGTKSC